MFSYTRPGCTGRASDMLVRVAVPTIPAEEENDQKPTPPERVCLP